MLQNRCQENITVMPSVVLMLLVNLQTLAQRKAENCATFCPFLLNALKLNEWEEERKDELSVRFRTEEEEAEHGNL